MQGLGGHRYLGPEADGEGDGLHGVGVATDVEAAEEDARQVVALGVEVRQVADVVRHHARQRHRDVCRRVVLQLLVLCASNSVGDGACWHQAFG